MRAPSRRDRETHLLQDHWHTWTTTEMWEWGGGGPGGRHPHIPSEKTGGPSLGALELLAAAVHGFHQVPTLLAITSGVEARRPRAWCARLRRARAGRDAQVRASSRAARPLARERVRTAQYPWYRHIVCSSPSARGVRERRVRGRAPSWPQTRRPTVACTRRAHGLSGWGGGAHALTGPRCTYDVYPLLNIICRRLQAWLTISQLAPCA